MIVPPSSPKQLEINRGASLCLTTKRFLFAGFALGFCHVASLVLSACIQMICLPQHQHLSQRRDYRWTHATGLSLSSVLAVLNLWVSTPYANLQLQNRVITIHNSSKSYAVAMR